MYKTIASSIVALCLWGCSNPASPIVENTHKIDTVYIETKKNFWGKEKTNTTIKSDSLVSEKIDTTIDH